MKWPGEARARAMYRDHMRQARECRKKFDETGDPVYMTCARIHAVTARGYRRNAWRGLKLDGRGRPYII